MGKKLGVEFEEGVAPRIEAQKGIVAMAERAQGGEQGFDGCKAGGGVGVDFRLARICGAPQGGDGAGFDGLDRLAHGQRMAPTGVEEKKGATCICPGQRRGAGGEENMLGKIGADAHGIGGKSQAGSVAQGADGTFAGVFAAPNDDEDGRVHGLRNRNIPRLEGATNEQNSMIALN